jgi:hypothetical protein
VQLVERIDTLEHAGPHRLRRVIEARPHHLAGREPKPGLDGAEQCAPFVDRDVGRGLLRRIDPVQRKTLVLPIDVDKDLSDAFELRRKQSQCFGLSRCRRACHGVRPQRAGVGASGVEFAWRIMAVPCERSM